MPEIETKAIEERAAELLAETPAYIWNGRKLPIPISDIADSCLNLRVCDVSPDRMCLVPGCPPLDPGQAISGLLLASRGEIWVNAEEAAQWPTRRRFTICHEIGHWLLHRTGQEALFCRHGAIQEDADPATRVPFPVAEAEANAFAAALLMPAHLLRHHYDRLPAEGKFERLCRLFGASSMAMGRRLHAVI